MSATSMPFETLGDSRHEPERHIDQCGVKNLSTRLCHRPLEPRIFGVWNTSAVLECLNNAFLDVRQFLSEGHTNTVKAYCRASGSYRQFRKTHAVGRI
jgi:hypothetical protein